MSAQSSSISGAARDQTGAVLPGVTVEILGPVEHIVLTDANGAYRAPGLPPGTYEVRFKLINFADDRRSVSVNGTDMRVDAVMRLAMNADVTVTGVRAFENLADVEHPEENLVGIAQSASQGAVTTQELESRPLMRTGELLETVPGVIVTQHSGEGKANQYFLRGFNLDHGTDLAQTVAGLPVNMPTHAHGQGYSDLNFVIPELVTGVQFSKGPYFAGQGDFATAGASSMTYANELAEPILSIEGGGEGYERGVAAISPKVGAGHLLAAVEADHNDGPWVHPDDFQKFNGVLRYSAGSAVNGFSATLMGYHGRWNSTDQVPDRAIDSGLIPRFGAIDPSDGGHSYRYSGSVEWQRGVPSHVLKVSAYGLLYDLDLFSNFTYDLNDPVHGDQVEQADHRFTSGVNLTDRTRGRWAGKDVQNTFGIQVRSDDIMNVGLYHTEARVRLDTRSQAAVVETEAGAFAQSEVEWGRWLRSTLGLRVDGLHASVNALDRANSGKATDGLVSPKAALVFGPWKSTEFYVNGGTGFHSNDARGMTITRDADGNPVDKVTPLVRATGAEVGMRTVAARHLQSTLTLWTLHLGSELVFSGDEGTTQPGRPSTRRGLELANYFSPFSHLVLDGDVAWSHARFSEHDPIGDFIPEAAGTVLSAGATLSGVGRWSGSVRVRHFGPRPLIEDNSVRSNATGVVNAQAGVQLSKRVKLALDVFNLFNAADSDIDYYYTSRLPGEPADGIADIHTHPVLPRTARVSVVVH
ncbi:MAG TPA: TonB-dependent receptor [Vicinamibacterales bacterium]|nr:TonB-dependent receptor [Vicinamibacterales bacterium]